MELVLYVFDDKNHEKHSNQSASGDFLIFKIAVPFHQTIEISRFCKETQHNDNHKNKPNRFFGVFYFFHIYSPDILSLLSNRSYIRYDYI